MEKISIGVYDCLADPSYRSAQGKLGIDNAFSIKWAKYFPNIKKHPSNLFYMVREGELGFLIFNNGNFTVTKAKNDEEIYNFVERVKKIIFKEMSVDLLMDD